MKFPLYEGPFQGSSVDLHRHSDQSFDAIAQSEEACEIARDMGKPGIGVSDHGTLGELLKLNRIARKMGLTPILGGEFYMAIGDATRKNDWLETYADDIDPDDKIVWSTTRLRKQAKIAVKDYLSIVDGFSQSSASKLHLDRLEAFRANLAKPLSKWSSDDFVTAVSHMAGSVELFQNLRQKRYYHITIFAETPEGFQNLLKLHAWSCRYGWKGKHPRIDMAALRKYGAGLIILTGCLGGPIQTRLVAKDFDGAVSFTRDLIDIAGPRNVFVEVMNHNLPVEQGHLMADLKRLSREVDVPTVATNDSHYTKPGDAELHRRYLHSFSGGSFEFSGDQTYYDRPSHEMRDMFDGFLPEAVDTSLIICERVAAQGDVTGSSGNAGSVSSAWADVQGGMVAAQMLQPA
jgi:DNA polymerase III alpha subunit